MIILSLYRYTLCNGGGGEFNYILSKTRPSYFNITYFINIHCLVKTFFEIRNFNTRRRLPD